MVETKSSLAMGMRLEKKFQESLEGADSLPSAKGVHFEMHVAITGPWYLIRRDGTHLKICFSSPWSGTNYPPLREQSGTL